MTRPEERSRNIGILSSIGIHVALLLLLFFTVAMTAPDPPIGDFGGAQMMLGFDDEGSGEIQPEEVSSAPNNEETKPAEQEERKEEVKPTVSEKDNSDGQLVGHDEESPVVAKEGKKVEKREPVKEKEPEKVNPAVEFKKEEKKETKGDGQATDGGKATGSQGNDLNKTGDKGRPEGTVDGNALYGNGGSGGGNGMALSMSGWAWADPPKVPSLPDNADGRIVFEIECDEDGEIVGITTVERGLSPKAEQLLKEEIRRNSLIRTSNGKVPERSKGRVVFLLKTQ